MVLAQFFTPKAACLSALVLALLEGLCRIETLQRAILECQTPVVEAPFAAPGFILIERKSPALRRAF
jgi:hypothetical protein